LSPAPSPSRLRRFQLWLWSQAKALATDPLLPLLTVLITFKAYAAVALINNANHAVLKLSALENYTTQPLVFYAFSLVPLALGFCFQGRSRIWFYVAVDAALSLLLVADLWYFRASSTFLSFLLWQQAGNLHGLWSAIAAMSRRVDLIFVADLIVLVPLFLLWKRPYQKARSSLLAAGLLLASGVGALWYKYYQLDVLCIDEELRFVEPCWEARQTISFQSPFGFHVFDAYDYFVKNRPIELSEAQRQEIRGWFETNRESLPDNGFQGLFKGRNLIIVQVESLENFVIGRSVKGKPVTPVLNSLLPHSFYVPGLYDQANEGMSSDSDLMLNTSLYPVRRGSTFFQFPNNTYNSLPVLLEQEGYTTLAMHPDLGVYWNWRNALTSIGFDTCLDIADFRNDEILGLGLSDRTFLTQAAERIQQLQEPFYAFMVTLSSHTPFELPEELYELGLDHAFMQTNLGKSLEAFHYVDKQIGLLLSGLQARGVLDRSVVVFTGDHSSLHRFFADEVATMKGLEPWMRDDRQLVPLIIYSPDLKGKRVKVTGGQIDTMPTVLDLLGVDPARYKHSVMGRNLLNTKRDFAVVGSGPLMGRDKDAPFAKTAQKGLGIADLVIRGNYFKK
jgi:lipoteichoic acid synthase